MGQIRVRVAGRTYPLACRDGEEDRLTRLAEHVGQKAEELSGALGQMPEPRLLLMAAILIADDYFELRETETGEGKGRTAAETRAANALADAAERIEALAASLEKQSDEA